MDTREKWVDILESLSRPVLERAAAGVLHEYPWEGAGPQVAEFAPLECLARLLCGVAPWLASDAVVELREQGLREELAVLAREALLRATTVGSPSYLNYSRGGQPLVDTAFLCQALIRGRAALWDPLSASEQAQVVAAVKSSRVILPHPTNWLLFSAMVESFLCMAGEADWDRLRIDAALRAFEGFYLGDGIYGDGADYHADYYNSYVIQPFLLDILYVVAEVAAAEGYGAWLEWLPLVEKRAVRYAEQLERLIAVDGSFPAVGRSLCYRAGAFQALAERGWREALPASVSEGQVRSALTAVMERTLGEAAYGADGFLTIGLVGAQPELAESYINTGSVYLTATVLLPLGLGPDARFWSAPAEAWTACRVWGEAPGARVRDVAYDERDHRRIGGGMAGG